MARRLRGFTLSDQAVGVLFMVPFVLTALFFMVYPIVEAVRMAFFSYNPLRPDLSAFVGLSRIRETAIFGGAPLAAYHDQLKCGVGVIELSSGNTIATLQFANGVEEIFDVQILPETRCPTFDGSPGESDEVWLLPARVDG